MKKQDIQKHLDARMSSGVHASVIAECAVYEAVEMASLLMMKHDDLIDVKTGADLIDMARLILEREDVERGR